MSVLQEYNSTVDCTVSQLSFRRWLKLYVMTISMQSFVNGTLNTTSNKETFLQDIVTGEQYTYLVLQIQLFIHTGIRFSSCTYNFDYFVYSIIYHSVNYVRTIDEVTR